MKRLLTLALIAGLALCVIGCASVAPAPVAAQAEPAAAATTTAVTSAAIEPLAKPVSITILHTNDMHSRAVESKTELGYSRIATIVAQARAENPYTLVIDAGDAFHGLPFANLERGASIVKLMNAVGYDYMAPGNHDFNYGKDRLQELDSQATFKILAANIYQGSERLFAAYDVKDFGGLKVAVFGLATPETTYKSDAKNTAGLTFTNPVEEAKKVMAELQGKADFVICVSHLGNDASSEFTSDMVIENVPGIDVLVDGHSHSSLASEVMTNGSGALAVSADSNGTSLGVVKITVGKDRKVVDRTASTITLTTNPGIASNPSVKAIADAIVKGQDALYAVKVGATAVALEGKREIVRTSETNLGKLIANGMRYATGADFAFVNGGGVRDSIPAGDITKKQLVTVQPFGNMVWTTTVKGSEIDAIVEHGVGKLPAADGRFPQWANLTYTLDAGKAAGDRVSDIMIGGVPVDPNKDYTLALINFEFTGGDEYKMFAGKAYKEYTSDLEATMAYIQKLGTVTPDNIEMK